MFGIGLPELGVIALVAVFVFGPDKMPELARQAAQMVRHARNFANGARDELRSQLGPEYADLELRDLDPRVLARKHLLEALEEVDRADEAALTEDDEAGPEPTPLTIPETPEQLTTELIPELTDTKGTTR